MTSLLEATLGWAVVALLGHRAPTEQRRLTLVVAISAVWPLLLLGIALPNVMAFVVGLIPFARATPTMPVRLAWISVAVVAPLVVGRIMTAKAPRQDGGDGPALLRPLHGFRITVAFAAALIALLMTIPVVRVVSLLRKHTDEHLPFTTTAAEYDDVVALIDAIIARYRLGAVRRPLPRWLAIPVRTLSLLGGSPLRRFIPRRFAYWKGPSLELALYTDDLLIRGACAQTAFAHAVLAENLCHGPGLSTYGARARDLEKQIHELWTVLLDNPARHTGSCILAGRLREVVRDLESSDIEWEDWQVLYRKSLQLGAALSNAP